MRDWQVERRKRTRHLIELGGLIVKAGVVELIGGGPGAPRSPFKAVMVTDTSGRSNRTGATA